MSKVYFNTPDEILLAVGSCLSHPGEIKVAKKEEEAIEFRYLENTLRVDKNAFVEEIDEEGLRCNTLAAELLQTLLVRQLEAQ